MYRNILVAVDGGKQSNDVLAQAARQASAFGATVHVLCAADVIHTLEVALDQPTIDVMDRFATEAKAVVSEAIAELQKQGCASKGTVAPGSPAGTIIETATTLGCDLIVIGHRHLSWLSRLLEPSVCAAVLEGSPCPVLVVPMSSAPAETPQ